MTAVQAVNEDLKIIPGIGATMSVGSDRYAWYVSEVLPNGVIGMYEPHAFWDDTHSWEGGTQVVAPFSPEVKSEVYIKRRYGKWWKVQKDGKPISRFTSKWKHLNFGHASSYRDPSF